MEIDARNFIKTFKEHIRQYIDTENRIKPETLISWNSNTKWTKHFLGTKYYSDKGSPIGETIKDLMEIKEYRTEYNKIDLLLSNDGNFRVKDMYGKDMQLDFGYYPKHFDIIVEHENNIETCWEEMAKLTCYRAKLKVLITYNYPEKNGDNKDTFAAHKIAKENFGKIIQQSNEKYPENEETEYLLLIGHEKIDEEEIYLVWNYILFNIKGEEILLGII